VITLELKLEIIRQRRTQEEVARATRIHASRLSRILNDKVTPRPEELGAIAEALGVNIVEYEENRAVVIESAFVN
jgi:transcriptional regulator with XRE-family HTH domain